MTELVRRYADRNLGGTDASVIAVCERLAIVTVATVNLRDFANVRPRHAAALTTVPWHPQPACQRSRGIPAQPADRSAGTQRRPHMPVVRSSVIREHLSCLAAMTVQCRPP
jgi:hypothetical protein